MDNIIFLDIDGVLNDNDCTFSTRCVNNLKMLINQYSAKVVIISSWQGNGTVEKRMKVIAKLNDIGITVNDFIDPNFEGEILDIKLPSRVLGIVDYLKNQVVDKYVILDDDYHNDYRLVCLNHYKTNTNIGLSETDLDKINFKPVNLNNFKYINYQYRQLGEYENVTNQLIKVLKMI